ncbi:MAG: TetR/AcrR family transcriptional regulator [Gemmatimonadetes bacterium]|nr:TetR/AcrR family transcriptional regulator [Gemmatimonadota bacterium]
MAKTTTRRRTPAAPPRPAAKAPSRAADADTERRILDAARQVFIQRGTAGARMQEIAAEAGVNQALLHYYFRSKDALALAVFREAAGRLFPVLMRILGSDQPLATRITQCVHHYIDTLREHPFLPGYVLAELTFHPERIDTLVEQMGGTQAREAMQATVAQLDRELARAARAREIRPMRAQQFIANLASLCVFPFAARPMLRHILGVDDWDRFLDARRRDLPEFILNALRP